MIETTIVIEDVGISATTIHLVHHVCKLAIEIGMRGFWISDRELALRRVVFSHTEHFYSIFILFTARRVFI